MTMQIRCGDDVIHENQICRVTMEVDQKNIVISKGGQLEHVSIDKVKFHKRAWVSARVMSWFNLDIAERRTFVITLVMEHKEKFTPWFNQHIADNVHVFDAALREVVRLKNEGVDHYSMRTIVEYLRHHSIVVAKDKDFKINNLLAPDMARLMMFMFKELEGFFELRCRAG